MIFIFISKYNLHEYGEHTFKKGVMYAFARSTDEKKVLYTDSNDEGKYQEVDTPFLTRYFVLAGVIDENEGGLPVPAIALSPVETEEVDIRIKSCCPTDTPVRHTAQVRFAYGMTFTFASIALKYEDQIFYAEGIARKSADDNYNAKLGRDIAVGRAYTAITKKLKHKNRINKIFMG